MADGNTVSLGFICVLFKVTTLALTHDVRHCFTEQTTPLYYSNSSPLQLITTIQIVSNDN